MVGPGQRQPRPLMSHEQAMLWRLQRGSGQSLQQLYTWPTTHCLPSFPLTPRLLEPGHSGVCASPTQNPWRTVVGVGGVIDHFWALEQTM